MLADCVVVYSSVLLCLAGRRMFRRQAVLRQDYSLTVEVLVVCGYERCVVGFTAFRVFCGRDVPPFILCGDQLTCPDRRV